MAGRYKRGSDAVGIVEELAELDPVIADDARIGRSRRRVLANEIVDDLPELGVEVQCIKWNVEPIGHATGVLSVCRRAAALLVVRAAL